MTAIIYQPCATLRYQQTADDRDVQDVLDCLARLDWDALQAALDATSGTPVAELDLTDTQPLVALPETPGRDGEHPRWTAAMRQAVSSIDARTADWSASVEAQARRDRELPIGDDWTDEPTKADHSLDDPRSLGGVSRNAIAGGRASAALPEDAMTR